MRGPRRSSRRPAVPLFPFLAKAVLLLLLLLPHHAAAFFPAAAASSSRAALHPPPRAHRHVAASRSLAMRDASMIRDFAVGDRVRIVPNVVLDGMDWGGLVGVVTTTWEKCEVDPHCCCAEVATEGPIRVDFSASDQNSEARLGGKATNYNFFGENELVKLGDGE